MQRKTVTIVFTDVVGSTTMGEGLDPEILRRVMTTYFDRMRAVLERHEGTVEKFIGDAIMAVFGIPELHEDDALRAVRAAAEMRAALGELNEELDGRWGVRIEARMGVNTGEVLAEEARADTPLSADATNTAARLEQAAAPGEILLGEATHRLVRDAVDAEPAGPVDLKGKAAPVPVWRLLRVSAEPPGVTRTLDSPIVGRDRELSLLQEAFEQAVARRACRLATVLGVPGVGKSRLAAEFVSWLAGRARVLRGRCPAYGEGVTFWPVAEVIRQAAGITDKDEPDSARGKVVDLLGGETEAEVLGERLLSTTSIAGAPAPAQETFWAVRRLLEALAAEGPVVVVFDDVHWGQPTFLDLVEYLGGWSTGAPILLLCLARPELLEARPSWAAGITDATSIRLEPLTEEESERLIDNLLGEAPLAQDARDRIRVAAEGNPLFVEEILRMLVDDGLLRREDGRWSAAGNLSSIAIPPTIGSLLASRLERLTGEERAVTQRASVVGKTFWWGAVADMSPEGDREGVAGHLQSLVRRQLVRPDRSSFTGEDAFRFSHILIRDAAYAGTTKEHRADLHERFADWLERRAAGSPEHEEFIGYHLEQAHLYRAELGMAGDRDRALARRAAELLGTAGQRAFSRYDIPAAIALLSRAAAILDRDDPLRLALLVPLGEALGEAGQTDRSTTVLDEALAGAEARADDRLGAHAILGRWFAATDVSRVDALIRDAEKAVAVFEKHDDRQGLGRAWALVGRAHWHGGRAARAEEANDRALGYARNSGDVRQETECLLWLGAILAQGPRPAEGAAHRARTVIEEKRGNRTIEAYMSHALAHLLAWQGRFEEARDFARRYTVILTDNGQASAAAESMEAEADVVRTAGDIAEAARLLEEGQRRVDEMGVPDRTILPFLANVLYLLGRDDEAEAAASRAREAQHPLWGTVATAVMAKVRAREGRGEEAERLAREAVAIFDASDFLVFRGRALMDLAEVLRTLGRDEEAGLFLERAVEVFERKGAVILADQARSALSSGSGG